VCFDLLYKLVSKHISLEIRAETCAGLQANFSLLLSGVNHNWHVSANFSQISSMSHFIKLHAAIPELFLVDRILFLI
jgi:hypothetical protein